MTPSRLRRRSIPSPGPRGSTRGRVGAKRRMMAVMALAAVALAGCGGNGDAGDEAAEMRGDPEAGRQIFTQQADPACATCHTLEDAGATGTAAPNLDELQPSFRTSRTPSGPAPASCPRTATSSATTRSTTSPRTCPRRRPARRPPVAGTGHSEQRRRARHPPRRALARSPRARACAKAATSSTHGRSWRRRGPTGRRKLGLQRRAQGADEPGPCGPRSGRDVGALHTAHSP
jgi:hypothetical protein